jgi:hypothetical protein
MLVILAAQEEELGRENHGLRTVLGKSSQVPISTNKKQCGGMYLSSQLCGMQK